MKNTVKINRVKLAQILKDEKIYKGCNFVGFDMLTNVTLLGGKKNTMQGRVTKVHVGFVAMLFSNKVRSAYGKMVNKRLDQSGADSNFEPSKLPWGVRVNNTASIEHKGNDYVQLIYVQHSVKLISLAKELGIELGKNDVELERLMTEKVIAYNTPNGNISYLLDGKPIEKDAIEGLKLNKANGKQGGLKEEMKVIVRSPKLESITRMTLNGVRYEIED